MEVRDAESVCAKCRHILKRNHEMLVRRWAVRHRKWIVHTRQERRGIRAHAGDSRADVHLLDTRNRHGSRDGTCIIALQCKFAFKHHIADTLAQLIALNKDCRAALNRRAPCHRQRR